jgi:ABC-2 type transport system permease protein
MIMGSMHILTSLISFWVPRSQNASELLFWTARQFIDYPIDIFARPIRFILVFAIPMAFVNYLPAHIFLGKALPPGYPDFLKYLSPAVGVVLIGVTVTCIRIAIRHYKSTGS